MVVNGFHIKVDELAELLHISIEEYRRRLRNDRLSYYGLLLCRLRCEKIQPKQKDNKGGKEKCVIIEYQKP